MQFTPIRLGRRAAAVAVAALLVAGAGIGVARASDHQDNPLVELNPAMDMTDVYAFPGSSPDRIALVLNSWAFLTPGAGVDHRRSIRTCSISSRSTTPATRRKIASFR